MDKEYQDNRPLCIDLYAGLGGWTEGFLANGYRCVGFDIEAHDYGTGGYPGELRLHDVRSLHGSQFKDATCLVGSSPCQEFSYRAMPWKRAKALPPPYLGIELFQHQFRIQREASEAAGHHIPMVVENVRGAEKWVGPARWHFGSYYLWGDVPALMPPTLNLRTQKQPSGNCSEPMWKDRPIAWLAHQMPDDLAMTSAHVDGRKVPGFRFDGSGKSFQTASVGLAEEGVKQRGSGREWFAGEGTMGRLPSKSSRRKAASAQIAKIPFPLADWIAKCFLAQEARTA